MLQISFPYTFRNAMVHAASNTGYQGFQGFSTRPPPVLKPGETLDSRKTKFRNAGDGLSNSIASDMRDTTISATMSCGLSLSDYCVPDRRGVSAIFATASPPSKPCPGITLSRQSYCLDAINAPKSGAKASPPEWISKVIEDDIARLAGFVQSPVINTSEDKGANSYSVYAASACRQMHSAPTPNLR